jgi:hypothetical protein
MKEITKPCRWICWWKICCPKQKVRHYYSKGFFLTCTCPSFFNLIFYAWWTITHWHSSDLEINWHLTSSHWIFYYLVFWIPFYSGQHYLMIAVPQMTFYSGTSQMLKRLHWSHCVPDHCHNNHPNLFRSLKHHFHHISHLLMADFHLVNYLSHSHQSIFTTEAIYWWLTSTWWITWAILINPFSPQKPFTDGWLPPGELLEPFSSIWLTVFHSLSSSAYLLLVREWLQYLLAGLSKNISDSGLMKHKISDTYQRMAPQQSSGPFHTAPLWI